MHRTCSARDSRHAKRARRSSAVAAAAAAALAASIGSAHAYMSGGHFGTQATASTGMDDNPLGTVASVARDFTHERGSAYGGQASAGLADGILRAMAYAQNGSFQSTFRSSASATFWDRLVFSAPVDDAQFSRLRLVIDGVHGGVAGGGGRAQARFYWGYDSRFMTTFESRPNFGWIPLPDGVTVLEQPDEPFIIPGATFYVYAELAVNAYTGSGSGSTGFSDFGNTARFQWELPEGVTYTSASGVFMSAADPVGGSVPEPGALALIGMGCLAAGVRRRDGRWMLLPPATA